LHLERTRVDFSEEIALPDELTFLESYIDKLAVNAAADGDGVESGYTPQTIEINGEVATDGRSDNYGYNEIAGSGTTLTGRCRDTGILSLAGSPRAVVVVPSSGDEDSGHKNPEPSAAFGLRGPRAGRRPDP
jgi:hypothetical protein